MVSLKCLPAGDLAVLVEADQPIGLELHQRLRALDAAVSGLAGVIETVPSFRALLVHYDPLRIGYAGLCDAIARAWEAVDPTQLSASRLIELPCCYRDPILGFDLVGVAERLDLGVDELIRLQTSVDYLVYFIGFAPGQPYLAGMPTQLTIPRLETPRTRTPAGSVGIGGTQCCVYSVESPGGFWILGRTPVRLYDPEAREPVLLQAGDRLRFVEIDRGEFDRIEAAVAAGRFEVRVA